jgi:hypothetical protein
VNYLSGAGLISASQVARITTRNLRHPASHYNLYKDSLGGASDIKNIIDGQIDSIQMKVTVMNKSRHASRRKVYGFQHY